MPMFFLYEILGRRKQCLPVCNEEVYIMVHLEKDHEVNNTHGLRIIRYEYVGVLQFLSDMEHY